MCCKMLVAGKDSTADIRLAKVYILAENLLEFEQEHIASLLTKLNILFVK